MSSERPLILVTNDDGITAPGVRHLIRIMNKIGDVVVVAPDSPQSGMGHAITVNNVFMSLSISYDFNKHPQMNLGKKPKFGK